MKMSVVILKGKLGDYNYNVHFEGVGFTCSLHLDHISLSEARADLLATEKWTTSKSLKLGL